MQESRSKAEAGGDALAIANQDANLLESLTMELVALDIGEEREVVAGANPREMCRKAFRKCASLGNSPTVFLVGKDRKSALLKQRRFRRQPPRELVGAG